jgi:antitoxin (DNA-binding transcriptional repressor) of toxin-antitoxin stability system
MIEVSARDLRQNLSHYLDLIEDGEEVAVIRRSRIVGHIKPGRPARPRKAQMKNKPPAKTATAAKANQIEFRRFSHFDDPQGVLDLHKDHGETDSGGALVNADLHSPDSFYDKFGGEFWVGELNGKIVATGGYRLMIGNDPDRKTAELRRILVVPNLNGQGVRDALKQLLIQRANENGFSEIIEQD